MPQEVGDTRAMKSGSRSSRRPRSFQDLWPEPDWIRLAEETCLTHSRAERNGKGNQRLAIARALRDFAHDKRKGMTRAKIAHIRTLSEGVLDGSVDVRSLLLDIRSGTNGIDPEASYRILLYDRIGHEWDLSQAVALQDQGRDRLFRVIDTKSYIFGEGQTQDDAIAQFTHRLKTISPNARRAAFRVGRLKNDTGFVIYHRVAGRDVILERHDDADSAMRALGTRREELLEMSKSRGAAAKRAAADRRDRAHARSGPLRRQGDVTAEEVRNRFGLRAVAFGTSLTKALGQMHLNSAHDAFMDMADALGVPPAAVGLNGRLGLAFGLGGSIGTCAHYNNRTKSIHINRGNGAGAMGHEWFHALDDAAGGSALASSLPPGQALTAEARAMRRASHAFIDTPIGSRCQRLDRARGGHYYTRPEEMIARGFETWIEDRLRAVGISNAYLVNIEQREAAARNSPFPVSVKERAFVDAQMRSLLGKDGVMRRWMVARIPDSAPMAVREQPMKSDPRPRPKPAPPEEMDDWSDIEF